MYALAIKGKANNYEMLCFHFVHVFFLKKYNNRNTF